MNEQTPDELDIPHGIFLRDAEKKTHRKEHNEKITKDWKFPVTLSLVPPGWYKEPRDYHLNPQWFGEFSDYESLKRFLENELEPELKIFHKWCEEH